MQRPPLYRSLYFQVLAAIALGVVVGVVWPERGAAMRPLGDGFIKLVRMLIAPIIFTTIAVGIANMGEMKDVGRIGLRAFLYFEIVSTLALIIGLVVVNVLQPGVGLHVTATTADVQAAAGYGAQAAQTHDTVAFLLNIIPTTMADAFARGDILQVLLVATLTGIALLSLGPRVEGLVRVLDQLSQALFGIVGLVMRLAPIGAFGAMAFTVGRYGIGSLLSLGKLMAGVYLTCLLFVIIVLGTILRLAGLGLVKFLRYIAEEILIVLGTSSSESALPRLMAKLERLGCAKPVVGPRRARRLFVQSRRDGDLHDDGGGVRGAGERRAPHGLAAVLDARDPDADLERGRRRDRQRVHHARGDALDHPVDSAGCARAAGRRRSLHVGSARDHQPDRQRGRDRGDRSVGQGARSRARPPRARRRG